MQPDRSQQTISPSARSMGMFARGVLVLLLCAAALLVFMSAAAANTMELPADANRVQKGDTITENVPGYWLMITRDALNAGYQYDILEDKGFRYRSAMRFPLSGLEALPDRAILQSIALRCYSIFPVSDYEIEVFASDDDTWTAQADVFPEPQETPLAADAGSFVYTGLPTPYFNIPYTSSDLSAYILQQYNSGRDFATLVLTSPGSKLLSFAAIGDPNGLQPRLRVTYFFPSLALTADAILTKSDLATTQLHIRPDYYPFLTQVPPDGLFSLGADAQAQGAVIENVSYLNDMHAVLTVSCANPQADFDLSVIVDAAVMDCDYGMETNALPVHVDTQPYATASPDITLTATNIASVPVSVDIHHSAFRTAMLTPDLFTLSAEALLQGMQITSVSYISSTRARLMLACPNPQNDFSFSVTVAQSILEFDKDLTTQSVPVLVSSQPLATLSAADELTEYNLETTTFTLSLTQDLFNASLSASQLTLNSDAAAEGVQIASLTYIDSRHAEFTLTSPFSRNVFGLRVTISKEAVSWDAPLTTNELDVSGSLHITQGGVYNLDAVPDNSTIGLDTAEHVVLSMTPGLSITNCRIRSMVEGVDVELSDVIFLNAGNDAYYGINIIGAGNRLTLTGDNHIETGSIPAVRVPGGTQLTIDGSGSLLAACDEFSAAIGIESGENSGSTLPGIGVVGEDNDTRLEMGDLVIAGGTITAECGMLGAGIGQAMNGTGGSITITGGTVVATGSQDGAAIGNAMSSFLPSITISGGSVTAYGSGQIPYGGNMPAIGSGSGADVEKILITGGTVYSGEICASGGEIEISGGTVYAKATGTYAAAIGSSMGMYVSTISITSGTVYAESADGTIDDIGQTYTPFPMDVRIGGDAVVFLKHNRLYDREDDIDLPLHDTQTIADHQAYGFSVPDDWTGTAYAYFPDSMAATGVALTPRTMALDTALAPTGALAASVEPAYVVNQTVSFTSDNPGVAAVDESGTVTAVHGGQAVITATAEAGGLFSTCVVSVTEPAASVTVTPAAYTLYLISAVPGEESVQLMAEVLPATATNQSVTWESGDPAVATVHSSGLVSAVGRGTTTITITTADGGHEAYCELAVVQRATGVSLLPSATLVLGDADATNDSVTLAAVISPADANNQAVTFTSSNPAAATVDALGVVTARSAGSTEITVTTDDGAFTAVCIVTVEQRATGVSVTPPAALLVIGDEDTQNDSIPLSAIVLPADADEQGVIWSSSDASVAAVDAAGVVTALKKGTAVITAATIDGGLTDTCDITVEQEVRILPDANDGRVCMGGCITLTPSVSGGTWIYDPTHLSCSGNVFTPLRPGTSIVTYTMVPPAPGSSHGILDTLLGLLLPRASAESTDTASITITSEALTLTSSLSGGMADLHESFTLTPNFEGGTWSFDENVLRRNGYDFTTQTTAKTTVTYTYQGQTVSYTLEVFDLSPQTGDERPPLSLYALLAGLAALCLGYLHMRLRREGKPFTR